jgi:hypothetical protein
MTERDISGNEDRADALGSAVPSHTPVTRDLLEVVKAFVAETVDYMTINNLGDPEKQHNVKWARSVIAKAEGSGPIHDSTARGDAVAEKLRAYYEANREGWWARLWRRSDVADNLMLGLADEAIRWSLAYLPKGDDGELREMERATEYFARHAMTSPKSREQILRALRLVTLERAALSTRAVRPGPSFPQSSPEAGGE